MKTETLRIVNISQYKKEKSFQLPLFTENVKAGFPSPADDYIDKNLDLNTLLITHPTATFFVRVQGDSMIKAGIHSGDILIVDRAVEPKNNCIVIAAYNGELTVKRITKKRNSFFLTPENPDFSPIKITGDADLHIWGVVTYVIHHVQ